MTTNTGGSTRLTRGRRLGAVIAVASLAVATPLVAHAAPPYPSDTSKPDLVSLDVGYSKFWVSDGTNTLHGTVLDKKTLSRDDQLTVWINRNATARQRFKALQDSLYQNATNTAYDQSYTVSTGLGSTLSRLYVQGRNSGALPLTTALINSSNGSTGAYVSTSSAKAYFSHPRPYLPTDPAAAPVAGDAPGCAPAVVNASSQRSIRVGKPYADAKGNLKITRVPTVIDSTHQFSLNSVPLDPGYGTTGLCTGGSFPSGHTTTAYEAGVTLATLVPQLAPEVLTRASEAGNDRIVLGVHYPLDIMGGRIDGEAALAARWSDTAYRNEVLLPARAELLNYLRTACGRPLAQCIARQQPYTSNPYGGKKLPGGTAQIVTNRKTALKVYRERMTYHFARQGKRLAPSVPAGAANLLLTTYPTLSAAQRRAVLAQTEIASGFPLDQSRTTNGSWERLDLAAAMSARVKIGKHGSVKVVSTGGKAVVVRRR